MALNNSLIIGIAAVIVIVIIAGFAVDTYGSSTASGQIPIQLTDPPHVPSGTQSLTIQYSAVQAYYVNGTHSAWVNATGSGTLDLMKLQNTTTVIGTANVPNGSSITKVKFNVTSATININGHLYNVTLPESEITSNVASSTTVNSTSTILLDMSPTIITVFTSNQTLFIMVPSVKGVLIGNYSARAGGQIKEWEMERLDEAAPSINATSASILVNNQTTDLNMVVTNNGNKTVTLTEVLLFGNESANIPPIINMSAGMGIDVGDDQAVLHVQANENSQAAEHLRMASFIVLNNGTLVTPDRQCVPQREQDQGRWTAICHGFSESQNSSDIYGMTLQPGQSAKLTFDSKIDMGYGMWTATPIVGDTYKLSVVGSGDAHASISTVAT